MNLRSTDGWNFVIARGVAILSCIVLGVLFSTGKMAVAQSPQAKLSPIGEPALCNGCGHGKADLWQIRYRLKNSSDQTITVYGQESAYGEFDFVADIQFKDPYSCEWRYGNGDTENRNRWEDRPDNYKISKVLKPGEEIEAWVGVGDYELRSGILTRFASYIAPSSDERPTEVFSLPVSFIAGKKNENLTYRIVEDTCVRNCKMDTYTPTIQGVKLGMTTKELQDLFPGAKVDYIDKEVGYGLVLIWDKRSSKWSLSVWVVNEKVERIDPEFTSLRGTGKRPDIYRRVAKAIGMTDYVAPDNGAWRCSDFEINVVDNTNPSIMISSKAFKNFQAERNARSFRKSN